MLSPLNVIYARLVFALPVSDTPRVCHEAPLLCLVCTIKVVAMHFVMMYPWNELHYATGMRCFKSALKRHAAGSIIKHVSCFGDRDDAGHFSVVCQSLCNLGCRR